MHRAQQLLYNLQTSVEFTTPEQDRLVKDLEKELEKLVDRSNELSCLESAGVDNWENYGDHFRDMREYYPDTYQRMFGE